MSFADVPSVKSKSS